MPGRASCARPVLWNGRAARSEPPDASRARFALEHVTAQARTTFSVPTGLSGSGKPEPCDTSAHEACWNYRHRCASNYVNVDDMNYGHFHLPFEDATLSDPATFCFADPSGGDGSGFGRKSGDECLPADWKKSRGFCSRTCKIIGSRSGSGTA